VSERQLHLAVADLIRQWRVPKLIAWHTPNESVRTPRTGAYLKKMMMLPGVPDFVIVPPGGRCHFLELKFGKGKLSPAQEEFKVAAISCPCPHSVVRTIEEAATVLHLWGAIKENPFAKQQARAAA
jgi:hypothetical protein